jgi:hypothetical protein
MILLVSVDNMRMNVRIMVIIKSIDLLLMILFMILIIIILSRFLKVGFLNYSRLLSNNFSSCQRIVSLFINNFFIGRIILLRILSILEGLLITIRNKTRIQIMSII